MSRGGLIALSVLLLLRQAVAFLHGSAHAELSVPLAPWQQAFVIVVITILPFVALGALWWLRTRAVLAIFAALIAAGLLFGLYFHFGPMNPDHVSHQPVGSAANLFHITAIALVVADLLILSCCAAFAWRGSPHGR